MRSARCSRKKNSIGAYRNRCGHCKNGLVAPVEDIVKKSNVKYAIYDKTQPNPTVDNVEEALKLYHKNNCDTLIAIGGGSAVDCAKAIGARVAYPKKTVGKMGDILRILRRLPTLIAIPTTAGTGSETTLAVNILFLGCLIFLLFCPLLTFEVPIFRIVCIVYALIISAMLGKAVGNFVRE